MNKGKFLAESHEKLWNATRKSIEAIKEGNLRKLKRYYPFDKLAGELFSRYVKAQIELAMEHIDEEAVYFRFMNDYSWQKDMEEMLDQLLGNQYNQVWVSIGSTTAECMDHVLNHAQRSWCEIAEMIADDTSLNTVLIKHLWRERMDSECIAMAHLKLGTLISHGQAENASALVAIVLHDDAYQFAQVPDYQGLVGMIIEHMLAGRLPADLLTKAGFEGSIAKHVSGVILENVLACRDSAAQARVLDAYVQMGLAKGVSISRVVRNLREGGVGDPLLRLVPSTKREVLGDDLGL